MKKVLFVCTANIHRSRFAEEVFNHLAKKSDKDYHAFSAGLKVGDFSYREIYYPALENLKNFKIEPIRPKELSKHIDNVILEEYYKIICMDKNEHRPMVNANPRLSKYHFEYWDIVDIPKVDSTVSLPLCYEKVVKLFEEISL
jgi:protein-tyrosine phosphatase|tara:strand:+ start:212 stop:640 length:429 start_codon:yes stop_codon:yes gene_type:complete